ncbi:hypothetical protein JKP88DRAFT_339879 [Tribonema minus]|uniref:NYN domain-containing protein n=1 Tax=Tribonema minus TaxID=303371 RepID=A0A835YG49_9STRA|nr:hypothetical protein JKP88DRAFT_339879 [Tribonema minus]
MVVIRRLVMLAALTASPAALALTSLQQQSVQARVKDVCYICQQEQARQAHPRELHMKSSKKKSRPTQSGGGGGSSSSTSSAGGSASSAANPQRVDPKLNIPVRYQIRWAQMKKENTRAQQAYRKDKREKTKFRRNKEDEPDYVEEIDLSKVKVTDVLPTLLVDGYNIIMSKLKKRMEAGETERARAMLLDELAELSVMRGWSVKVSAAAAAAAAPSKLAYVSHTASADFPTAASIIFDAYKTDALGITTNRVLPGLETVFTSRDQTADQFIERETQSLKRAGCPSVMVFIERETQSLKRAGCPSVVVTADRFIERETQSLKRAGGRSVMVFIEREAQSLMRAGCPSVMVATGDSVIRTIASAHGAHVLSPSKVVQEMKVARRESIAIATARLGPGAASSSGGGSMAARRMFNNLDEETQRIRSSVGSGAGHGGIANNLDKEAQHKIMRLRAGLSAEEDDDDSSSSSSSSGGSSSAPARSAANGAVNSSSSSASSNAQQRQPEHVNGDCGGADGSKQRRHKRPSHGIGSQREDAATAAAMPAHFMLRSDGAAVTRAPRTEHAEIACRPA